MSAISKAKKQRVIKQSTHCRGCGVPKRQLHSVQLTVDHIVPKSQGGTDAYWNLQMLCRPCNQKKGSRMDLGY